MQLSTRQILEASGLNSLDEVDSSEDVELLQESIEEVSAKAPEGVAAGLWGVITTAAGLNTSAGDDSSTPLIVALACVCTRLEVGARRARPFAFSISFSWAAL